MTISRPAKAVYARLLSGVARVAGTRRAKEWDARWRFGRRLDLDHPRTLADKVSWISLNTDQTTAARLADKIAVRDFVAERGLGHLLVPMVGGSWESVDDIDLDALPQRFVVKASHGCEMTWICRDRESLDERAFRRATCRWLSRDYGRACVEPHYRLIPHRLFAEELLGGDSAPIDYKFHCLNGEPAFILVCSERERSLKLNLHDLSWHALSGLRGSQRNDQVIPRPRHLEEMIAAARTLSQGFDFVRIDLYDLEGGVRFGEMTFTPACGVFPYYTDEFVRHWGEELHVSGLG